MTGINYDSLEGSRIEKIDDHEDVETVSIYKPNIEHRFITNPEGRIQSDKPIINMFKKHNTWMSISAIVDVLGLAERTAYYACKRLVKHGVLESKKETITDTNSRRRGTNLYRMIPIKNNEPSPDKGKIGRNKQG